ncbi:MAG: TetR/AcrR family transcriptional regulator [Thermoflexibacteraceae bacterium]
MDTRTQILQKNFEAICVNGYQATRTDKVIASLGITKGAFYHYFPDKASMGYAIVEEILYPMYVNNWLHLKTYRGNPIDGILASLQLISGYCNEENVAFGCPLNNLIQEMSPLDEGFRGKLQVIIDTKKTIISEAIRRGQEQRQISNTLQADEIAYFVLSTLEGSFSVAKVAKSKLVFDKSIKTLMEFLKSLKTHS